MTHPSPPDHSLVGRAHDCSVLSDVLTGNHANPVVVVHGEAGIGKTAILRWAIDSADPRDVEAIYSAGSPATSAIPFGGLRRLLSPLIEQGSPDPQHAYRKPYPRCWPARCAGAAASSGDEY